MAIPPSTKRLRYVIWSNDEINHLANLVISMRINDPDPPLTCLVNAAQKQIPEDRRRNISSRKQAVPLFKEIDKRLALIKEAVRQSLQPTSLPSPTKQPTIAETVEDLPTSILVTELLSRASNYLTKTTSHQIKAETMLSEILGRLVGLEINQTKHSNGTPMVKELPLKKKRICVVGLLPEQMGEVQSRCGNLADLRFVSKDVTNPQYPPQTDYVVLMANFINHSWQTFAYQQFRRDQVLIHHGGITRLIDLVKRTATNP